MSDELSDNRLGRSTGARVVGTGETAPGSVGVTGAKAARAPAPFADRRYRPVVTESTDPEFDELAAAAEAERKQAEQRSATRWAWVIVLVIAAVCGAFIFKSNSDNKPDPAGDASRACENFVKDRLKAPSTAKFSGESVSDDGTGRYTVTGSVDAQNSFGAMLRDHYSCLMRLDGDNWELITLTGLT